MKHRSWAMMGVASILSVGATGCLGGIVDDASSGSALTGVTVTATGSCSGAGCVNSTTGQTTTDSSGEYVFNPYSNVDGTVNPSVQEVFSASGKDAVQLTYTKSGYKTMSQYVHPSYSTYTYPDGNSYYYDIASTVYLCKTTDVDSDGDGVCDAAEAQFGTNPNLVDSDGDGFSDGAELYGLASPGVDLRYYGANAKHKDVFLYINYYTAPIQAALDQVVAAFNAAPLTNPDGANGVTLHIINGGAISTADQVQNFANIPSDWSQYDTIKNKYFPANLAKVFHYCLFGYEYGGGSSSGIARGIPAHDFLVTLGLWTPSGGTQLEQAGTLMHEFGHTLGLQHGGNEGNNYKPNYLSIMNYRYQVVGLYKDGTDGVLDYSRLLIGSVNEAALVENSGMPPVAPTTAADLSHYGAKFNAGTAVMGTDNGPLDFNNNGVYNAGTEAVDLNSNGVATDVFNQSWNDWAHLVYTGSATGGGAIGGGVGTAGLSAPQIVAASAMPPELDHP